MSTPAQEKEYAKHSLSLPSLVSLFVITFNGATHRFCGNFRLEETWWNGQKYEYLPLVISDYRYSEDNSSITPTLSLINVAALYSAVFAGLPNLIGAKVEFFLVWEDSIKTTVEEATSSLFAFRHKFTLSRRISATFDKVIYQLDPAGFLANSSAPSRLVLRNGLFNMCFPGVSKRYDS